MCSFGRVFALLNESMHDTGAFVDVCWSEPCSLLASILNVGEAGNDRYLEALSVLSAETAGLGD